MALIDKIKRCIAGYKHQDYDRVCSLAKLYAQIYTMQGQAELIVEYKPNETKEQKKSRIEINKSDTPASTSQVMSQFDYVNAANRMVDSIEFVGEEQTQALTQMNALVSRFYGRKTLQQFLQEKQRHYSAIDPNAWIVMGLHEGKPVPICINCENAVDFKDIGGITEYLIVQEMRGKNTYFYGYEKGQKIVVIKDVEGLDISAETTTPVLMTVESQNYLVFEYNTQNSETPAIRFGYTPDDYTEGRTFVGIFQPVTEQYKDLINQKSELCLSLNKHTFLKRYQFADRCTYHVPNEIHFRCDSGELVSISGESKGTCPKCNGTGVKMHHSSQDVIVIEKPKDGDEAIMLDKMEYYSALPIDIVGIQQSRVNSLIDQIPKYIFGVDLNKRAAGFATATEINNFLDAIYMTISPYADKISENYKFVVVASAEMMGINSENLVVSHKYPRRFKMETLGELIVMLKDAMAAGASSEILQNIELQIAEIQNSDSPEKVELIKAKNRYKPFKNLTKEAQALAAAALPPENKYSILYFYLDVVFNKAMQKTPTFLQLDVEMQNTLIEQAVEEVRAEIKETLPSLEMEVEEEPENDIE